MIATPEQISKAREILKKNWENEGDCMSCGWHACLYEHDVEDYQISDALADDGILRLTCVSSDADDPGTHRGVKVCIIG